MPLHDELAEVAREVNGEADPKPSWQPVDLRQARADADDGSRAPTLLRRADDVPLLYRGTVNALIGESESGKSWVALMACAQELEAGGVVTFIDFESDEVEVSDRLIALGIEEQTIYDRFTYVRPEEPGSEDDFRQYVDSDLVILDGITEAMSLYALSPLDASDYAMFHAALCRPLTKAGAAVVTIDHVTKSKDGRGAYAFGSQHKKAALDGCAIIVEPIESFGRERHGTARLIVGKDRRGYVRKHEAGRKKVIGVFNLNSLDDRNAEAWIEPASEDKPSSGKPTACMEAVSRLLENVGTPLSNNQLEKNVAGFGTTTIRWARDELVKSEHIRQAHGPRQGVYHELLKPYREFEG